MLSGPVTWQRVAFQYRLKVYDDKNEIPMTLLRFLPALISALLFVGFANQYSTIAAGGVIEASWPWLPTLGVELAFRLDGLSLLFALLITGIGAIILSYAADYFKTDPRRDRLQILMGLFALSMLGLVLADDAISLFLFWEGTTLTSFLLVGFDHHRDVARRNAVQALIITGLGGLALLIGLITMHQITGTWRLSEWNALGFTEHAAYPLILLAVLVGCFTKSAQFPFHYWLPNAMAAPTPVSAYLHSATMVKAGIYLMLRLNPALGGSDLWMTALISCGAITMILGALWALRQTDLKLMMAYTTVMALGALTLLIGLGSDKALMAAIVFILVHALYKAALFLSVGMMDKQVGTRDLRKIHGMGRRMPIAWACAALGALSMAGIPPLLGFLGKELIYAATLGHSWWVSVIALAANVMMVMTALAVAWGPFTGSPSHDSAKPISVAIWWGSLLMGLLALTLGSLPSLIDTSLIAPILSAVTGREQSLHLSLWHGINGPLLMSLLTYALGFAMYRLMPRIRATLADIEARYGEMDQLYQWKLDSLHRLAAATTRQLQNGRMTFYLRVTFGVMSLTLWAALLNGALALPPTALALSWVDIIVGLLAMVGTWVVVRTESRLIAISALGIVGATVSIVFVMFGAIDVAMTQLLVDTLMVVFIAVALVRLPRVKLERITNRIAGVIAITLGAGVTLAMLAVLTVPIDLTLSNYFGQNSLTQALGRNVVNVILVDFRAMDTLGEISVVVIAALAAIAALKSKPEVKDF